MQKNNGDIVQFVKQRDYIMINNNLGSGSFGKTVLLQDPFINEFFVAKKYEPEYDEIKEKFYKNFLDEIKILFKLNHRNIVRLYNYYAYEDIFTGYILMEYIDGMDIRKFFEDYVAPVEAVTIDDIFAQLISGFKYIEENGIIHRDIRESNILIDKTGIVKIIDFGIGKVFEKTTDKEDSLVGEINRSGTDTLPQEYYSGIYTSQTDMFYLADLFNRLIKDTNNFDDFDFSYQSILEKMMEHSPKKRFVSFAEIKDSIDKHDFINLDISQSDRDIYQMFSNSIYNSLIAFVDERKFNHDISRFISTLEKTLRDNCFEDLIQDNSDVIGSLVTGIFKYNNNFNISCADVKDFLDWFRGSTKDSQKLILTNIIAKLSSIRVDESEPELELPF